ncbi:MAG: glycerophosphodiester phosphodiesterase [Lachnospiraceae bacterium]|nr:glycerophosphodiester phosphodiesterase [Lachnospiraceae bacterium]
MVFIIIGSVIVFLCAVVLFMIMPGHGCKAEKKVFDHLNIAHRGLHTADKKTPENSLAAFSAAAEAGYGIEMDIQFTKDKQIVVFHDDTLDRVCGVPGRVDNYTYEELEGFRLEGTQEKIPLFTDFLSLVDGRVPLLIELKHGKDNTLLCERAMEVLRDYKGDFCIESFNPFIVGWFKKHEPRILRGQLSAPKKEFVGTVPAWQGFMLSHLLTNVIARPHFVAYNKEKHSILAKLCDKLGAMRFVWTVRGEDDHKDLEKRNDAMIFELYRPSVRY